MDGSLTATPATHLPMTRGLPNEDAEPCQICDAIERKDLLEKSTTDGAVTLVRCSGCGLVVQRGAPRYFEADLYGYYAGRLGRSEDELFPRLNRTRQRELLRDFERAPGRRLLDIGCGMGQLVRTANENGWSAIGIDLAVHAIATAKAHGLPCEVVDLFAPVLDSQRFDVITMVEFIEHVANPVDFIARSAALLNPGGILYLTTPNFDSVDRVALGVEWRVIHPEHLIYFDPRTIRRAIAKAGGLKVRSVQTHNLSVEVIEKFRRILSRERREFAATEGRGEEQEFRASLESSAGKRLAKQTANCVLSGLKVGSTIKLFAQKI